MAGKLHAQKSPSGSGRWAICHASVGRERALQGVRASSAAADRGTCIHDLGEHGLLKGSGYISERLGCRYEVRVDGTVLYAPRDSNFLIGQPTVDETMIDCAERYVEFVEKLAMGGDLFVEQRLSIEHITGEPDAKGTTDAAVCFPDELAIIDLKGGFIRVMASYPFEGPRYVYGPEELKLKALFPATPIKFPNTQLVMYAEAVRYKLEPFYDFKRVRIIIVQPALDHVDEHVMGMEEFAIWVNWIREQSLAAEGPNPRVVPSESTCQWCSVFPCPEAQQLVLKTALDDFEEINKPHSSELGRLKKLTPLVRMWADSIDSRVYSELSEGREVWGWKLVEGDLADRKWSDDEKVRAQLASFGLTPDDYLASKLVSPAQIEKLVIRKKVTPNKKLTKEQWETLQALIPARQPTANKVVPESDPRPAVVLAPADDFDAIGDQ